MAAVTINSQKYNVNGSMRDSYYNITGNPGDTLTVGMTIVRMVDISQGPVTAYSVAAGSVPGTSVITFTASGPFTALAMDVVGN